ncbi:hypothetical protein TYRP_005190 [Tyrophagus putrescentiae]|nr:hypothetical protein TYRP_005190 [Tyrophagus putrescentiae]
MTPRRRRSIFGRMISIICITEKRLQLTMESSSAFDSGILNVDVLQVAQLVGDAIVDVGAGEVNGEHFLNSDWISSLLVQVAADQTEAVAHAGKLFGVGETDADGGPGNDWPDGW